MFLKATITTFGCDDLTLSETGQSLGALEVTAGILLIGGAMHFLFLSPHVFIGRNQNLCIGRRIGQNRKCEHEIICLIWLMNCFVCVAVLSARHIQIETN